MKIASPAKANYCTRFFFILYVLFTDLIYFLESSPFGDAYIIKKRVWKRFFTLFSKVEPEDL